MSRKPSFCRSNTQNFYESSRKLHDFLKLFGIACFTIQSDGQPILTFADVFLCLINIALCSYLIIPIQFLQTPSTLEDSIALRFAMDILTRVVHFSVFVTILTGFVVHRSNIAGILNAIHAVDLQLSASCGVQIPHKCHWLLTSCMAAGFCVHGTLLAGTSAFLICQLCDNADRLVRWLTVFAAGLQRFYACQSAANVFVVYYCLLWAIRQRLRLLNAAIEAVAVGRAQLSQAQRRRRTQRPTRWTFLVVVPVELYSGDVTLVASTKIQQLRCVHANLVDITDRCNRCFALPVTVMGIVILFYLRFQLLVAFVLLDDERPDRDAFLALSTWQNAFYMIHLLAVLQMGSRLSATARQTCRHIQAAMTRLQWTQDSEIIGELLIFGQQCMLRKPRASCFGKFTFQWSLAFSVSCSKYKIYIVYI